MISRTPPPVHDLGLASATLTLEATARGLWVHQMIGIVPARVTELYGVPEGVQPTTGIAIGYAADPSVLPDSFASAQSRAAAAKAAHGVRLCRQMGEGARGLRLEA